MAVDLSIQVFSYELFNTFFSDHGLISKKPVTKAVYDSVYCGYKGEVHTNLDIAYAVYCRQAIFHDVYRLQFEYTDLDFYDSPSDFLAFMCCTFSSQEFKELKVFEHIFATFAFVVEMCLYCFYRNNTYFIGNAYLCWAMYFDTELKSDFYAKGGWNVLKSVARSYTSPFLVIKACVDLETMYHERSLIHSVPLRKLVAGMEDFYNFQTFSEAGENLTRAKTWVDFQLNNKNSKKSNRAKFDIKTVKGLEHILRCFKFLCDPLGDMVLDIDASIHDENVFTKNPVNKAKNTPKTFDFFPKPSTSFTVVPEPIELPETIQSLTDAVHALTLDTQAIEPKNVVNSDTPVSNQDQQDNSDDDSNTGVLSVYDMLKDSLNVDNVWDAMFHTPVFMCDKNRNEWAIKVNVALDQIPPARKNPQIVQKESPTPTSDKIFEKIKSKKKKKRTKNAGHETSPIVVHSATKTGSTSDKKIYSDDTKDVLRMILVLGCQPGHRYVRSTLKKSTEETSL